MMQSTQASANNKCPSDSVAEACKEALYEADAVIEKQGELVLLLGDQNTSLKDENQKLSDAIIKLHNEVDSNLTQNLLFGSGGLMLGIIVGIVLSK